MLHSIVIAIRKYANKLVPIPFPQLIEGNNSAAQAATILAQHSGKKPLIVTDKILVELGLLKQVTDSLEKQAVDYVLFDQVTPDPTIALVEQGVSLYKQHQCDSYIAIGGGSAMDCTKAIAASASKNKSISQLAGLFKIHKKLPPLIALPTTAGTGSETTLVAVITDPIKRQKFTVIDPSLVPQAAIVDPQLMLGLPAKITAETGMDALTHAVESYIGLHASKLTREYGLKAVKQIFTYLPLAYHDGSDVEARREMAIASYNAGVAFTRASIGYVHAIAHQLGGYYHIPHGLANAVLLPHILDFSLDKANASLAQLACHIGVAKQSDQPLVAAQKFIEQVKALNSQLNIPTHFAELKAQDIPLLAKRAIKEAYCEYPVPKQMSVKECEAILTKLLA